jgi:outer membrane scaffolding protein for murein synthesis (MipA/OmpV family)
LGRSGFDATATQDVAHAHGGAALQAWALLGTPLGRIGLKLGPQLRVATRGFMQAYYGVDPGRSAASGRPAYVAGGGLERPGMLASAE